MWYEVNEQEARLQRENADLRLEVRDLRAKLASLRGTEITLATTTYFRIKGVDGWYFAETSPHNYQIRVNHSALLAALDRIEALEAR